MYNPFPFDDPRPVNRPELCEKTINAVVAGGTPAVARQFVKNIRRLSQMKTVKK